MHPIDPSINTPSDMTGSSVVTWLRIALENNSNNNNNNNGQNKGDDEESTSTTSTSIHTNAHPKVSLIDRKGQEKVIDERSSSRACAPGITISEQTSSLGGDGGDGDGSTGAGEDRKKLTVINMMGGEKGDALFPIHITFLFTSLSYSHHIPFNTADQCTLFTLYY